LIELEVIKLIGGLN